VVLERGVVLVDVALAVAVGVGEDHHRPAPRRHGRLASLLRGAHCWVSDVYIYVFRLSDLRDGRVHGALWGGLCVPGGIGAGLPVAGEVGVSGGRGGVDREGGEEGCALAVRDGELVEAGEAVGGGLGVRDAAGAGREGAASGRSQARG
jgi:hypothetical protein